MANNESDDGSEEDEVPMLVELPNPNPISPPCPVTILSGFLGAGKTTLIQYILRSPDHGKRIAIIENEYADAGLSVESMIAKDGMDNNSSLADLIELPNGCLCCTVKDSLVVTLEQLLKKREDLDYIIIECSGLANPGPIAATFWLDDALESRLVLDGIVTIVDAINIERQLQETVEASQQVAYADRILLNKIDLLVQDDDKSVDRLTTVLRDINPTAQMQTSSYGAVDTLDWLLDANCFDMDRAQHITDHFVTPDSTTLAATKAANICGVCHSHTAAVSTVSLVVSGSVSTNLINKWMAKLLWPDQDEKDEVLRELVEHHDLTLGEAYRHKKKASALSGQEVFRIKGIVSVKHEEGIPNDKNVSTGGLDCRRYVVQGVHDLWDIHASPNLVWDMSEDRCSKLIFIGRNLDEKELRSGLESCHMD